MIENLKSEEEESVRKIYKEEMSEKRNQNSHQKKIEKII